MAKEEITTDTTENLPVTLVQRLVTIALVAGLIGGAGGSYLINNYGSRLGGRPAGSHITLQEDSAIIEVVKKVSPSVVSITTQTTGIGLFGLRQTAQSAGTGIIITEDGLIMTNNHVVEGGQSFSVFDSAGKEYKNAQLVAADPAIDIAFLRINAKGLRPAELGDSSNLVVGQKVIAIGNALGRFQNTATEGIISGLGRPIVAGDGGDNAESLQDLIQTDAAINPGNSGGPLVNSEGKVIGINTAVAGNAQNIGFAIPISEAQAAIKSVKGSGKISRPYLGVRYIPITKEFASRNNLKVTDGAYVTGSGQDLAVIPNSPAQKAGIKEGDILTKIGDDRIDSKHSVSSLIGKRQVGDKVGVTLVRDDKEQTVEVTLEEVPENVQ